MKFLKKKLLIVAVFILIAAGINGNICEAKGRTFVVGFDAEFPPYGILMKMVSMWVLTFRLQRRSVSVVAGSL